MRPGGASPVADSGIGLGSIAAISLGIGGAVGAGIYFGRDTVTEFVGSAARISPSR